MNLKAYFVHPEDEYWGYVVHAQSPSEAKFQVYKQTSCTWDWEYINLRARRQKNLDNISITIGNMIDAGFDMTFEGEPIDFLDVKCECDICKNNR